MILQATSSSDRACENCPAKSYTDGDNQPTCMAWDTCVPGEYIKVEGTSTSPRECNECAGGAFSTTNNGRRDI